MSLIPDVFAGGSTFISTLSDYDVLLLDSFECPRGTKLSISHAKIISTTKINGMKGTVKEVSGYDDWNISIEFTYVSPTQFGVLQMIRKLKALWFKQEPIAIGNKKINALGIKKCVITQIEFPDEERDFELPIRISAISDEGFDISSSDLSITNYISEEFKTVIKPAQELLSDIGDGINGLIS
ncbi:MAG: DUF6046 domain-containing protein [Spirochaetota bacterium]